MKLAIISHTEHYQKETGEIVGWGPTITEINHLANDFEEIYHVAFLYSEKAPASALPYGSDKIKFIPLTPVGGPGIENKIKIVLSAPQIVKKISSVLKHVDVFQFRAPTGMGVFVIPYLTVFCRKKGWFKYAGNWNQKSPPFGYAIQRTLLQAQRRPVTINGKWLKQPKHCLTFENPCLTKKERKLGKEIVEKKNFKPPFKFCFVGRLEDAKGVQRILDAFANIKDKDFVAVIHFVGDGEKRKKYEDFAKKNKVPAIFHGFLERDQVFEIYAENHFFLLPSSASEGFPKVIAEAMNFGCIPIVSSVSSISQYVNQTNGFTLNSHDSKELKITIEKVQNISELRLMDIAKSASKSVSNFTFEFYRYRIQNEIINKI